MVTGSSSNVQFVGNNFARKDVIFVSFNTRESIFAYPNSAELGKNGSQNFGILDVQQALEWIHSNIAAFGGNPDHSTFSLFEHSFTSSDSSSSCVRWTLFGCRSG
jgi:carboxylesterase type B